MNIIGGRTITRCACGLTLAASVGMLVPAGADASAFTAGDLVVERIPSSTNGTSTQIFLDEITQAGGAVQSIGLPTTVSEDSNAGDGQGGMTRSTNGQYLLVTAVGAPAGSGLNFPDPSGSSDVFDVPSSGVVPSTANIALTDAYQTVSLRSVASTDGQNFYVTGAGFQGQGGVRYAANGATTSTAVDENYDDSSSDAEIYGGQLFAALGNGQGIQTLGTGDAPGANAAANVLPGLTNDLYYQFWMADLPGGTGYDGTDLDTLYAVDENDQAIVKYGFDGTNWDLEGSVSLPNGYGLIGDAVRGNVNLFATTQGSPSTVMEITDPSATATSAFSGTPTQIASSSTGTYAGIAFAPISTTAAGWSGAQVARPAFGRGVELKWKEGSGADVVGFTVLRQAPGSKHRVQLTKKMIKGGSLSSRDSYSFTDRAGKAGDKYYVVAHLTNGKTRTYGPFTLKRTQDRVFVSRAIAEATR